MHTPAGHHSFWRRSKRVSAAAVLDYTVHLLGGATPLPVSFHTEPSSLPELLCDFRRDWKAFAASQSGCQRSQSRIVPCIPPSPPQGCWSSSISSRVFPAHSLQSGFLLFHDTLALSCWQPTGTPDPPPEVLPSLLSAICSNSCPELSLGPFILFCRSPFQSVQIILRKRSGGSFPGICSPSQLYHLSVQPTFSPFHYPDW